jgi:2-dehydro-3-deoxygalactonokinase
MIQEGKIASFQTFMTGETFAALSSHTVLRHSVSGHSDIGSQDEASFLSGITDSLADPSAFAGKLFSLRAEGLLNDMQPNQASARLSGLLIGLELAATKTHWENQSVGIIGTDRLSSLYSKALRAQGCDPQAFDGQDCALKGLISAYESQKELA